VVPAVGIEVGVARVDASGVAQTFLTSPARDVRSIHVDAQGLVWASLFNVGVAVYDGSTWTTFTVFDDGLVSDRITRTSEHPDGSIWFAGELGVAIARASLCAADLTGSADPNSPDFGIPDGVLDATDFFFYLDRFAADDLSVADLTGSIDPNSPAFGIPDGLIDASDFFFYLDLFAQGCP